MDSQDPDIVYERELILCSSEHHSKWAWALYVFKGRLG